LRVDSADLHAFIVAAGNEAADAAQIPSFGRRMKAVVLVDVAGCAVIGQNDAVFGGSADALPVHVESSI